MNQKKNPPQEKLASSPLTLARTRLFILITFLIPLLFFMVLEIGLRIFHYGGDTRLFVSIPDKDSKYYGVNLNIGKRYFHSATFNPTPRKDLFLKEKPENGFRIFVLGGSTTAGFPYGNNITFTRILNRRLSDQFPERKIEIINTAMTAINSYTLLDFMDEIIAQKPNALLIYAGHNEFYGALGVGSLESLGQLNCLVRASLRLQRLKTFLLIRNFVRSAANIFHPKGVDIDDDPLETQMARIAKQREILYGSRLYQRGIHQFRKNLQRIFRKADRAGIPILIGELVSNIHDQHPFVSVQGEEYPPADEIFNEAQKIENTGNFSTAREMYYFAKDLDALRFRASEDINQIIHNLAGEFGMSVVPLKARFRAATPRGIIGNKLICDHLHPNIDGYFIMADAFYNAIQGAALISHDWMPPVKSSAWYRENWGYTDMDLTNANLIITHLKGGFPFKTTGRNLVLYEFNPKTLEDSLALRIAKDGEITLEQAHIALAKHYAKIGDIDQAMAENKALIYTVPNLDLFYEPAVQMLIQAGRYEDAREILTDALKYNESFYIYKWLGQMNLVLADTKAGIRYLEKALRLNPIDQHVLFNLARAYYNTSQVQKGDAVRAYLRQHFPASRFIKNLDEFRETIR